MFLLLADREKLHAWKKPAVCLSHMVNVLQQQHPWGSDAEKTRCHWHGLCGGELQQGKPSVEASTHEISMTYASTVFVTRDFWSFDSKINGFSRLIVQHLYVLLGDPSCIGFCDITQKNTQTHDGGNPTPPRLPSACVKISTNLDKTTALSPAAEDNVIQAPMTRPDLFHAHCILAHSIVQKISVSHYSTAGCTSMLARFFTWSLWSLIVLPKQTLFVL